MLNLFTALLCKWWFKYNSKIELVNSDDEERQIELSDESDSQDTLFYYENDQISTPQSSFEDEQSSLSSLTSDLSNISISKRQSMATHTRRLSKMSQYFNKTFMQETEDMFPDITKREFSHLAQNRPPLVRRNKKLVGLRNQRTKKIKIYDRQVHENKVADYRLNAVHI